MKKEKERIICAIPKEDIYHAAVNTDEKSPAGQGECDLQAELSGKAAAQPEVEDCSIDIVPDVTKPGAVPTGSWEKSEGAIKRMGLSIWYLPVHRHKKINSILFFKADTIELLEEGSRPETVPQTIRIPANTIVINTNAIRQEYSSFYIFHEYIHYEEHYLFYCLQKLNSNDVTKVPSIEIDPEEESARKPTGPDDTGIWEHSATAVDKTVSHPLLLYSSFMSGCETGKQA